MLIDIFRSNNFEKCLQTSFAFLIKHTIKFVNLENNTQIYVEPKNLK